MCGIAIFDQDYKGFYDISHRGISHNEIPLNRLRITHDTLPIQTYGEKIKQPYMLNSTRYLLFNGEIFNFYKFGNYSSDMEYLIDFFSKSFFWNREEVDEWDGFWSICLIDDKDLYAFTDPLGKKQLYYNKHGICSEIKPLLTDKGFNYAKIHQNGFIKDNYFHDINRIQPNNLYVFENALIKGIKEPSIVSKNYFNFRDSGPDKNNDFKSLMKESVRDRLINKMDNISLLLSGGLDSSIILHHLLELEDPKKLDFITIENKENKYIEILEKFYDIKIRRIMNDFRKYRQAILSFEYPIDYGSLLPQYNLFENCQNTVVFSGDGADELFSGYTRALKKDTQNYDVFYELPYYHHIRLDRCSMAFTKECRNPFLSTKIIRYALGLPYGKRRGKRILKESYRNELPPEILKREKRPLRAGTKGACINDSKQTFIEVFSTLNLFKKEKKKSLTA